MTDILTLTLNPALDLATSVPHVVPNVKLRCGPETAEPGGGGVNVARAITQLGGHARAAVALAGPSGEGLRSLLEAADLDLLYLDAPAETRRSFAVTDASDGAQYRFVMPGPRWSEAQLDGVLHILAGAAPEDAIVVLSGSMPPGADTSFCTRACAMLGASRRVLIDTSGAHLEHLATAPQPAPAILRMDSHEAETLSGLPLATRLESAGYAEILRKRGAAATVIIARGKDGSVMADGTGLWHVNAANATVVSAIGAGDSFVGGYVMALAQGHPAGEALRRGAAAASAAVISEGTQLCSLEDWRAMLEVTTLTRLDAP